MTVRALLHQKIANQRNKHPVDIHSVHFLFEKSIKFSFFNGFATRDTKRLERKENFERWEERKWRKKALSKKVAEGKFAKKLGWGSGGVGA